MSIKLIFASTLAVVLTLASCTQVEQVFKSKQVIPDVVHDAPEKKLEVKYTKSGKEVNLGNELTPTDVKEIPEVKYVGEDKHYYTLVLTDPDAPSRKKPTNGEFLHWMIVNIPGNKISEGKVIAEYVGSAPPQSTDLHRYVFLLYKQAAKIQLDNKHILKTEGKPRGRFNIEKFAKENNLGKPVAGNFFQAKYDDSVPATHKQLGF